MDRLKRKDEELLLWIQEHMRSESVTGIMKFVTFLGDRGFFWVTMTLSFFAFKKTRKMGICMAIAMLLGAFATNLVLKPLIKRTRPYETIPELKRLIEEQEDKSFPSGHTTASFAASGVVCMMSSKQWGRATVLLASLIAYSRMYLGVHYLSDVLAGMSVGLGSAMIADEVSKYMSEKKKDKK